MRIAFAQVFFLLCNCVVSSSKPMQSQSRLPRSGSTQGHFNVISKVKCSGPQGHAQIFGVVCCCTNFSIGSVLNFCLCSFWNDRGGVFCFCFCFCFCFFFSCFVLFCFLFCFCICFWLDLFVCLFVFFFVFCFCFFVFFCLFVLSVCLPACLFVCFVLFCLFCFCSQRKL